MKKANVLEQVKTSAGHTQALVERDGHYMIWVNGRELMSTRHAYSEEQLGVVGCAGLAEIRGACVLVGGLGLGFTLRAALASLAPDAQVVVAELMPEIVAWNRRPEYPLAHRELSDPRTEIVLGDVERLISQSSGRFHAILLDADNETTAMNTPGNSRLYASTGVESVARALKPNGAVVYWSVTDDPALVARLRGAGFGVETQRVRKYASGTSGGYHALIVGRKAPIPPRRRPAT